MKSLRSHVFLWMCCVMGGVIGGLALPSIAAQVDQDTRQESVGKKIEGGVLLTTAASEKNPLSAPLLNTTVTMTVSGLIAPNNRVSRIPQPKR